MHLDLGENPGRYDNPDNDNDNDCTRCLTSVTGVGSINTDP